MVTASELWSKITGRKTELQQAQQQAQAPIQQLTQQQLLAATPQSQAQYRTAIVQRAGLQQQALAQIQQQQQELGAYEQQVRAAEAQQLATLQRQKLGQAGYAAGYKAAFTGTTISGDLPHEFKSAWYAGRQAAAEPARIAYKTGAGSLKTPGVHGTVTTSGDIAGEIIFARGNIPGMPEMTVKDIPQIQIPQQLSQIGITTGSIMDFQEAPIKGVAVERSTGREVGYDTSGNLVYTGRTPTQPKSIWQRTKDIITPKYKGGVTVTLPDESRALVTPEQAAELGVTPYETWKGQASVEAGRTKEYATETVIRAGEAGIYLGGKGIEYGIKGLRKGLEYKPSVNIMDIRDTEPKSIGEIIRPITKPVGWFAKESREFVKEGVSQAVYNIYGEEGYSEPLVAAEFRREDSFLYPGYSPPVEGYLSFTPEQAAKKVASAAEIGLWVGAPYAAATLGLGEGITDYYEPQQKVRDLIQTSYQEHLKQELKEGERHLTLEEFKTEVEPGIQEQVKKAALLEAGISGAVLGFGAVSKGYQFIKKPITTQKLISVKKITNEWGIVGPSKVRYVGSKGAAEPFDILGVGQIRRFGKRTEVTTGLRNLLGLDPLYYGSPYGKVGSKDYKNALKRLMKWGQTEKQARQTLRLTRQIDISKVSKGGGTQFFQKGQEPVVKLQFEEAYFPTRSVVDDIPSLGRKKAKWWDTTQKAIKEVKDTTYVGGISTIETSKLGKYGSYTDISKYGKLREQWLGVSKVDDLAKVRDWGLYKIDSVSRRIIPKSKKLVGGKGYAWISSKEPPLTVFYDDILKVTKTRPIKPKVDMKVVDSIIKRDAKDIVKSLDDIYGKVGIGGEVLYVPSKIEQEVAKKAALKLLPKSVKLPAPKIVNIKLGKLGTGIPKIVGGAGAISEYVGAGTYEFSTGGIIPKVGASPDIKQKDEFLVPLMDKKPGYDFLVYKKPKTKLTPISSLRVSMGLGSVLKVSPLSVTKLKPITGLKPFSDLKSLTKLDTRIKAIQGIGVVSRSQQAQRAQLTQRTKVSQRAQIATQFMQARSTIRTLPRAPKTKIPKFVWWPSLGEPRKPEKKRRDMFAPKFIGEIRRFGKWKPVTKPVGFGIALRVSKKKVRKTLGASLRIRKAKTGEIVPLIPSPSPFFRKAKREPGVLVQRREARLSDPFEVREIQKSRRIKWI